MPNSSDSVEVFSHEPGHNMSHPTALLALGWPWYKPAPAPEPELFAPPLWFVAWGMFFHTFGALVDFRLNKKVPLLVRIIFSAATFSSMLNHVYHLVPLSLEVQETVFLSATGVVLLSLGCKCRGFFFLELPRKRAQLLTALNVGSILIWPNVTKAAFGLDGDQPFVLGTPEYFEARGWPAPAQHFATEVGITLASLYTYKQVVPLLSGKAHTA